MRRLLEATNLTSDSENDIARGPFNHSRSNSQSDNSDANAHSGSEDEIGNVGVGNFDTRHLDDALESSTTYMSFGGTGYISPGRKPYHPTTDLVSGTKATKTSKKFLYVALTFVVVAVISLVVFFFIPRRVTIRPISFRAEPFFFLNTSDVGAHITYSVQETFLVSNPNYASLKVESIQLSTNFVWYDNNDERQERAVGDKIVLYAGSLSHDAAEEYEARTLDGDYSFVEKVQYVPSSEDYNTLKKYYLQSCEASSHSYMLAFSGIAKVVLLSIHSDVKIDKFEAKVTCNL